MIVHGILKYIGFIQVSSSYNIATIMYIIIIIMILNIKTDQLVIDAI